MNKVNFLHQMLLLTLESHEVLRWFLFVSMETVMFNHNHQNTFKYFLVRATMSPQYSKFFLMSVYTMKTNAILFILSIMRCVTQGKTSGELIGVCSSAGCGFSHREDCFHFGKQSYWCCSCRVDGKQLSPACKRLIIRNVD